MVHEIVRPQIEDEPSTDRMGRTRITKTYRVNQRDSYVIVAQLSLEFTARLVDRWQELEAQVAKPKIPQTYAEALRMAADQAEQLALEQQHRESLERTVGTHEQTLDRFIRTFGDGTT